jgi:2'-5' RNA ligase
VRLFVAIEVPEPARGALAALAERLGKTEEPVRWIVGPYHLTLKFLGEVEDAKVPDVKAGLDRAVRGIPAFEAAVRRVGGYPNLDHPRVIWAGVDAPPPLALLVEHVEREIEPLGFPREKRPWSPHVTIGRAREGHPRRRPRKGRAAAEVVGRALTDALAREEAAFDAGTVAIDRATLFQSELRRTGPIYTAVHEAKLGG